MTEISTFLRLSELAGANCFLNLNVLWRQLELHFDLLQANNKSEQYKIVLPLKYLVPHSFTVNHSIVDNAHRSIFFETSIPPQVWKRSETADEEALKERLYWSEQERWLRQSDIFRDPSEASFAFIDTRVIMKGLAFSTGTLFEFQMNNTLIFSARWRAYHLIIGTETPRRTRDVIGLFELLKGFNIEISERPIVATSDIGDALGTNIEGELQGLPYPVRYSFDVCISQGYLFISISIPVLMLYRCEYSISKGFIDRIKALPAATACGILDAVAAGQKYVPDPMAYLATAETTYKGAYRINSDRDLPNYCKRIQRCVVTPTTLLLMSPSIDVTNRVIRHFVRYLDRFLRVTCKVVFSLL